MTGYIVRIENYDEGSGTQYTTLEIPPSNSKINENVVFVCEVSVPNSDDIILETVELRFYGMF